MKKVFIILIILGLILGVYFYFKKNKMKDSTTDKRWKFNKISEFDSKASLPEDNGATYTKNGYLYLVDDGKNNMQYSTIDLLDKAREIIEKDWNRNNPLKRIVFVYNSAHRTKAHNKKVGGVDNSAHVNGFAVDISTAKYNAEQKKEILKALYKVGFRRFGIARNYIHVDNEPSKPKNVVWNYSKSGQSGYELESLTLNEIKNLA